MSRKPDREQRARRRDRGQNGVNTDAVVEPGVDAGRGFVDVPAGERDELRCERVAARSRRARCPVRVSTPSPRSAQTPSRPLAKMSVTAGSATSWASGPNSHRVSSVRAPGAVGGIDSTGRDDTGARAGLRSWSREVGRAPSCAASRGQHSGVWIDAESAPTAPRAGRATTSQTPGVHRRLNERGGAYWGEQAPPQQRLIGGNRMALRVKLSFDYGSV